MSSIRTRLLISLGLSIAFILTLSFAAVYFYIAGDLRRNFDEDLGRKARAFALMAEREGSPDQDEAEERYSDGGDDRENSVHFEFAEIPIPEYQPGASPEYYQVWDSSGVTLSRSPSLAGSDLPRVSASPDVVTYQDSLLPNAQRGRLAALSIEPASDEGGDSPTPTSEFLTLAVSRSSEPLDALLGMLLAVLSTSACATMLLMMLLVWATVRSAVAPLNDVCRELAQVGADELSHDFNAAGRPEELKPICIRLNELLSRLQSTFERERRFTSDVAHELRTPIAELRALAEVSLGRESAGPAEIRSFADTLDIALGMERIVTALLDIARCHSGQMSIQRKPMLLAEVVNAAWAPFAQEAVEKKLTVQFEYDRDEYIDTDPVLFGTILTNLFSNAVAYTPAGGAIRLSLEESAGFLMLRVVNDTDEIDLEDLDRIFETFWRKNGQGTDPRHAGVGLSLVMALARILGVSVESKIPSLGRFQITLRHPT